MPTDADAAAALRIVDSIRAAFPAEAASIDAAFQQGQWSWHEAPSIWLESFSQLTTDAIRRCDFDRAAGHLQLMADLLDAADQATLRCVDVGYVESLMWDITDDRVKRRGWNLIPAKLQSLYVAMWGQRSFMEAVREG